MNSCLEEGGPMAVCQPWREGVESKGMSKEYVEQRDGGFYVAGTRVSLDSLVHAFRLGDSPETIGHNFEVLRLEEVYGAIAFYLANQTVIDAYLVDQEQQWAMGKRTAAPLPPSLRSRLARARDEMHTSSRSS